MAPVSSSSSSSSWRHALGHIAMSLLEATWVPTGAVSYGLACLTPRTYPDTSGVLAVMERVLEELEKGGVEGLPQGAKGFKSMRGLQNVMLRGGYGCAGGCGDMGDEVTYGAGL